MPVRIPNARTSEVLCFGVAGVGALAPLYMILPGAEERLAAQTIHWAPRWNRNINYFVNPAKYAASRVEPPTKRLVQNLDKRLPLERMAKNMDSRIKRGIDRFQPKQ